MIRLLTEISKTKNIETGLYNFFQSFDSKENALIFWKEHFERSGDSKLITKIFNESFQI